MMERLVIVDSNYLAYKAKITTHELSFNGVKTGVIFGFFNQLLTIGRKLGRNETVFCWDSRKSLRREMYPDYKKKRRQEQTEEEEKSWEAAHRQFNVLRKGILPDLGFSNVFMQKKYEADDIIAKLVMENECDDKPIVVTSDDDLLQLLDHCDIYNLGKDEFVTAKNFKDKYGITPSQWVEVKKIAGCTSDNVKGIQGVGVKKAIQFIRGEMNPDSKTYKKIIEGRSTIDFNEKLVKLPLNGTRDFELNENKFSTIEFCRMCRDYGIRVLRDDKKLQEWRSYFIT
mgnify:CR=1 FL=1